MRYKVPKASIKELEIAHIPAVRSPTSDVGGPSVHVLPLLDNEAPLACDRAE